MSTRYVLLLRESDPRHAEAACASQEHALRAEVATRGGRVVDVVSDLGYSGALLDRPAIDQMLDLAERRQMDVVLCTELARLSRAEPAGYYMLRAELARSGVRLEFLDQAWSDDEDDEVAPLLEGIAVGLPQVERRRTARRCRRGKEHWWSKGFHWAPNPPYGFRYHPGGHKAGWWEINEDEAGWVREMYRLACAGYTLSGIGLWLTKQGAPTRKGGQWWPKTILGIMGNPQNYGLLAGRRTSVLAVRPYQPRPARPTTGKPGVKRRQVKTSWRLLPAGSWRGATLVPELAIVSKETFERAQEMRKRNAQTSPRRTREPSLLHGLVVCGCHDDMAHRMYYASREGRPPVWRCPYRAGVGAPYCTSYVRADRLEEAVWTKLVALARAPGAVLADAAGRLLGLRAQVARAQRRIAQTQAQVAAAQGLLDRLALGYYGGELPRDQYDRLRLVAQGEGRAAQAALAAAEEEGAPWLEHPLRPLVAPEPGPVNEEFRGTYVTGLLTRLIEETLGAPADELEQMGPEERRRRIKALVEQVVVEGAEASLVCALTGRRAPLDVRHRESAQPKQPYRFILHLDVAA